MAFFALQFDVLQEASTPELGMHFFLSDDGGREVIRNGILFRTRLLFGVPVSNMGHIVACSEFSWFYSVH
jgi:hypothetical protein